MSYARTPRDIFLVTTNVHAHSSKMYFSTPEKHPHEIQIQCIALYFLSPP